MTKCDACLKYVDTDECLCWQGSVLTVLVRVDARAYERGGDETRAMFGRVDALSLVALIATFAGKHRQVPPNLPSFLPLPTTTIPPPFSTLVCFAAHRAKTESNNICKVSHGKVSLSGYNDPCNHPRGHHNRPKRLRLCRRRHVGPQRALV